MINTDCTPLDIIDDSEPGQHVFQHSTRYDNLALDHTGYVCMRDPVILLRDT